ncbi:hypothetical protein HOLleu_12042 [Holothuria leucospilota]|uniref:Uncharacterized protein n=1 Tax=Holothuria leucospilota TaxID=206669 RepID=A0A9Q1CAP9_HOLLE|nr:hypothetical protein HOLleu_12042 [Holothuria leucospilota]
MMFSAMMTDAFHGCGDGIHIRYRTDGGLFNPRRLLAVTKVKDTIIRDFLFADDCALSATTESSMQTKLQTVDQFTYQGSTFTTAINIDAEVNNRTAKASSAFGRLREKVWERRGISTTTKLKVYKAVVLTTLHYACENLTVYRRHANQLNHFHMSCLRRLLHIRWQDMVPDTEILRRANLQSIFTLLQKAQVRWAGHTVRLSDDRLPKQPLYGQWPS